VPMEAKGPASGSRRTQHLFHQKTKPRKYIPKKPLDDESADQTVSQAELAFMRAMVPVGGVNENGGTAGANAKAAAPVVPALELKVAGKRTAGVDGGQETAQRLVSPYATTFDNPTDDADGSPTQQTPIRRQRGSGSAMSFANKTSVGGLLSPELDAQKKKQQAKRGGRPDPPAWNVAQRDRRVNEIRTARAHRSKENPVAGRARIEDLSGGAQPLSARRKLRGPSNTVGMSDVLNNAAPSPSRRPGNRRGSAAKTTEGAAAGADSRRRAQVVLAWPDEGEESEDEDEDEASSAPPRRTMAPQMGSSGRKFQSQFYDDPTGDEEEQGGEEEEEEEEEDGRWGREATNARYEKKILRQPNVGDRLTQSAKDREADKKEAQLRRGKKMRANIARREAVRKAAAREMAPDEAAQVEAQKEDARQILAEQRAEHEEKRSQMADIQHQMDDQRQRRILAREQQHEAQREEKRFFQRRPKTAQEEKAAEKKEARSKWNERWNTVAVQREKHGNPQMPTYMQKAFTRGGTREEDDEESALGAVVDAVLGSYEGESDDGGFY